MYIHILVNDCLPTFQETFDRRLVCSYRKASLPYYRFKQELISVSPYVVLFYEVISDQEIDTVIATARKNVRCYS